MLLFRSSLSLLALALALVGAGCVEVLWVSPSGSDSNPGTPQAPLKTPTGARDAIRALPALPAGGVVVYFEAGDYGSPGIGDSVLELDPQLDSGAAGSEIVYTAAPGAEGSVRFVAGVPVPPEAWVASGNSTNTTQLLQADLAALGLTSSLLGELSPSGIGGCAGLNYSELVVDGEGGGVLGLARYPNLNASTGLPAWALISSVPPSALTTAFAYGADVAARVPLWEREVDPWLHGYWRVDWTESFVKVVGVNVTSQIFNISSSTPPSGNYFAPLGRYAGVNLLCELDTPTEYYIDRARAVAYVANGTQTSNIWVSVPVPVIAQVGQAAATARERSAARRALSVALASDPHRDLRDIRRDWRQTWEGADWANVILQGDGAVGGLYSTTSTSTSTSTSTTHRARTATTTAQALSFVTVSNIALRFGSVGVDFPVAVNVTVSGVDASFSSGYGVVVTGFNNTVNHSVANETGCTAFTVGGGNSTALVSGNNVASELVAAGYARTSRTYNPGVLWSGVGNTYTSISVSDAPHQGFLGLGALNSFSNVSFQDLLYETDDAGAWYSGYSWVMIGNRMESCTFRDVLTVEPVYNGANATQAIYNDDELSSNIFINNTVINAYAGLFIGGGRSHAVHNNTFLQCAAPTRIDDRGLNWQNASCTPPSGILYTELVAVTQGPFNATWRAVFPQLFDFPEPCVPVFNVLSGNTWCGGQDFIDASPAQLAQWQSVAANNTNTC